MDPVHHVHVGACGGIAVLVERESEFSDLSSASALQGGFIPDVILYLVRPVTPSINRRVSSADK
jgi:hypothetical protein